LASCSLLYRFVQARQEAAFFKSKSVRVLLSAGVAGGYAEYARLLAQHMGNHLAGKPDFIVQSIPGAGGLLATNYLYSQAPRMGPRSGSSIPRCRWRRSSVPRGRVSMR
jgi:tripartite-type tricarboxylate transporter receptor subunit TctC